MVDIYSQFKDFKGFEVTLSNKDGQLPKIFCTVSSIENNNIIIEADNKKNNGITAEVGEELNLYIFAENGIYSASSKVNKVEKNIEKTIYTIAYPANTKHSQRREYFRADMQIKFKLKIVPKDEAKGNLSITGKTKNICGKGMSYVSNKPFPEHSSMEVNLIFDEKTVNTDATYVYSKQITTISGKPSFIHAFTFITIPQKDIDFIVKKCFLYQLEVRKQLKDKLL